jgi:hypothetical protein
MRIREHATHQARPSAPFPARKEREAFAGKCLRRTGTTAIGSSAACRGGSYFNKTQRHPQRHLDRPDAHMQDRVWRRGQLRQRTRADPMLGSALWRLNVKCWLGQFCCGEHLAIFVHSWAHDFLPIPPQCERQPNTTLVGNLVVRARRSSCRPETTLT